MTAAPPPRLLLVDDEQVILDSLGPFLERAGLHVRTAADGEAALAAHAADPADIVVSDVVMPRLDGRSLVRRLRAGGDWTPVLLLTQVGESYERSAALEEGADDYLNKPFDPQELLARVRAVLRRAVPGQPPLPTADVLVCEDLRVERSSRRVRLGGEQVQLTPKASLLLDYLMTHPGELHTRERLLSALWGFESLVTTRAVDHRVAEIRRVLRDDAASPRFVETVPQQGYLFCGTVRRG